MDYIRYNREERDLCAHLFRLLLHDQPNWGPLKAFLGLDSVDNPRIYCEVALIRDAYHARARKPDVERFVSSLCEVIAEQEHLNHYTPFSELPDSLRDATKTHPKHIAQKLSMLGADISLSDKVVYGSLQAMFNAKPDLVVCEGKSLYVFEAKYTLGFDPFQLKRTLDIAEVWLELLFEDLGFESKPLLDGVRTIGMRKFLPSVAWEDVYELALKWFGKDDFSTRVLAKVIR